MGLRYFALVAIVATFLMFPCGASALTMDQFTAICNSGQEDCSENPILQAYVGGALDLIAMLDEETDYLTEVYCMKPAELFDVAAIIRFMDKYRKAYATRNAMLLVIRYLEEQGGC